ncbi:MAG: DUF350 domain-containing protein [Syntrophobacterales bacterium]|nr:DUF350 domain-containing protein [Syntrophobacterales bacterium]
MDNMLISAAKWVGAVIGFFVGSVILLSMGRAVFTLMYPRCNVKEELVDKDNPAMAIVFGGYVLGIALAIGGSLVGPSLTVRLAFYDLLIYGPLGIGLMFCSHLIAKKIILHPFDMTKEIVEDRNCGTGIIIAANHIAMGLIVYGAIAGEGNIFTAFVFWFLGQLALVIATLFYRRILPFDLHQEVERDNVAVGIAFAGVLIATGNIVRFAIQGNFLSWERDLLFFALVMGLGVIFMPIARMLVEKVMLSGRKLMDELVRQDKPNIGAAIIEAMIYVALSFLVGWSVSI